LNVKNKGGQTLYEIATKDEKGEWRGTAEVARLAGVGEQTVRRFFKEFPEPPKKGEYKYVAKFEDEDEHEGYKLFKQAQGNDPKFKTWKSILRRAWNKLNQVDMKDWGKEEYAQLFNEPPPKGFMLKEFRGEPFAGVPESTATALHHLIRATGKESYLALFKGKKYPKGGKREWFLEDEDIISLTTKIVDNETLLVTLLGINCGGRMSSLKKPVPQNINWKDAIISMYEPKREEYVERVLLDEVLSLFRRYIEDYNIQPSELLFTQEYDFYLNRMKAAGKDAKIPKTVSTHILKHTFVTQAHRHGVSAETIVEQTGTDWATLKTFYRAIDEKKRRHEIRGEEYEVVPFNVWLGRLVPYFEKAYERIKNEGIMNGMRGRIQR
jgi:integrase